MRCYPTKTQPQPVHPDKGKYPLKQLPHNAEDRNKISVYEYLNIFICKQSWKHKLTIEHEQNLAVKKILLIKGSMYHIKNIIHN